jgi:CRP-like cAMP-binding protein
LKIIVPDATTGEQVVVASLAEGNYFGEISLLKLDGGRNRSVVVTKRDGGWIENQYSLSRCGLVSPR